MSSSSVVQLLFPMGGLGTRFSNIGITTPKPLILVDGKAMIFKAVSSFDGLVERGQGRIRVRLIFIVRQEHEDQFLLRTKLAEVFAEAPSVEVAFVMMTHDTQGAAETCLLAKSVLIPDAPVVIMDCDTYFRSSKYEDVLMRMALEPMSDDSIAGLLVHFRSKAPRYSYALVDEDTGYVVRTAEKVPISDKSLIGAYAFGSGKLFVDAAEKLVASPIDPERGVKEYYISLVFNFLLSDGRKVVAVERDDYASFGTPEELALYQEGKQSWVTE
jgi:dTDP-glucose pyrophosphorylase